MKRLYFLFIFFLFLRGHAQIPIASYSLCVTSQMTTNIQFPYRIEKADIGSPDVIGRKDPKLENVLFLKANRKNFSPTNLSVYTSDGKFYSFIVYYKLFPDTLNISFVAEHTGPQKDALLDSDATLILNETATLHRRTSSEQMKMILNGIFIKDHLMWIRITLKNHSAIDYSPENIRFFICDRKLAKRTARQESDLSPVWRTPDQIIPGPGKTDFLFAFPPFTLDKSKKLVIQTAEKNGGRILFLQSSAKILLKSKII